MALLAEDADTKTRFLVKRITAIARTRGQVIVNQATIALHNRERDLLGLVWSKRFDRRINVNWFEFAEIFHLQGVTYGKIKVGNAVICFQHGRKDLVEVW